MPMSLAHLIEDYDDLDILIVVERNLEKKSARIEGSQYQPYLNKAALHLQEAIKMLEEMGRYIRG